MPNVVVLTLDRLALRMLGCYGNLLIRTPNLDRLAATGMVFDRCYAASGDDAEAISCWWRGLETRPETTSKAWSSMDSASIFMGAKEAGVLSELICERGASGDAYPIRRQFQKSMVVTGSEGLDATAEEVPFAKLVQAATARLVEWQQESDSPPRLLWLSSAGVPSPWLAPRDYARRYLDLADEETTDEASETESFQEVLLDEVAESEWGEDSAAALDSEKDEAEFEGPTEGADDIEDINRRHTPLPAGELRHSGLPPEEGTYSVDRYQQPGDHDGPILDLSDAEFDRLLQSLAVRSNPLDDGGDEMTDVEWRLAREIYAGYVTLLDEWIGHLLHSLESWRGSEPPLLLIVAGLGDSLGESTALPREWGILSSARMHVPLLAWHPRLVAGSRCRQLVQTTDLLATVAQWLRSTGESLSHEAECFASSSSLVPHLFHPCLVTDRTIVIEGRVIELKEEPQGELPGEGAARPISSGRTRTVRGMVRESSYCVGWGNAEEGVRGNGRDLSPALFEKPEDFWDVNDLGAGRRDELESALLQEVRENE